MALRSSLLLLLSLSPILASYESDHLGRPLFIQDGDEYYRICDREEIFGWSDDVRQYCDEEEPVKGEITYFLTKVEIIFS